LDSSIETLPEFVCIHREICLSLIVVWFGPILHRLDQRRLTLAPFGAHLTWRHRESVRVCVGMLLEHFFLSLFHITVGLSGLRGLVSARLQWAMGVALIRPNP
jgi:hypothetical protein